MGPGTWKQKYIFLKNLSVVFVQLESFPGNRHIWKQYSTEKEDQRDKKEQELDPELHV